jgi:pyrimidine operon attenuation protein/uracil phosphoribosyltransferase
VAKHQTIGAEKIRTAIQRLAEAISERHRDRKPILLLGIANGGIELAHRLNTALASLGTGISSRAGPVVIRFRRNFRPRKFPAT